MGAPDERAAAEASTPRFAAYFRVRHYEADAVGRVNYAAYLHYLEQTVIEHSAAVGYPLGRYRGMGSRDGYQARRGEHPEHRPLEHRPLEQSVPGQE